MDVRDSVSVPVRVAVEERAAARSSAGSVLPGLAASPVGGERDLRRDVFRGGHRDLWVAVHSLGQPAGADAGAVLRRVRAPTRSRGDPQAVRDPPEREV